MAGKVADKGTITKKSDSIDDIAVLPVREETKEELIARVSEETTSKVFKEIMPFIERIVDKVGETKQPIVEVKEDLSSMQSRIMRDMNRQFDARVNKNRGFVERIANAPREDLRRVSIPRMFKKYFGPQLLVGLNTSVVSIPIDGRVHLVHKDFLPIIRMKLDYEDQKIDFMEQTDFEDITEVSDVQSIGNV